MTYELMLIMVGVMIGVPLVIFGLAIAELVNQLLIKPSGRHKREREEA